MAKKGMARHDVTHTQPRNEQAAVPEIQGKAKNTKTPANPIIEGTNSPSMKVYHSVPHDMEEPISDAYPEIDTDLARDNMENDWDMTEADKQDQ